MRRYPPVTTLWLPPSSFATEAGWCLILGRFQESPTGRNRKEAELLPLLQNADEDAGVNLTFGADMSVLVGAGSALLALGTEDSRGLPFGSERCEVRMLSWLTCIGSGMSSAPCLSEICLQHPCPTLFETVRAVVDSAGKEATRRGSSRKEQLPSNSRVEGLLYR